MKATSINRWLETVAAEQGPKIAITFLRDGRAETEMTYAQLQRDVNRLANSLLSLGVQKGDRVVLFIPKSLIAVVAHFAIQAIGAMAVPLNPGFKKNEMAYLLGDTAAKLTIVEPQKKALVRGIDPDGREVCQAGRTSFGVVRMGADWKIVSQHYSLGDDEE